MVGGMLALGVGHSQAQTTTSVRLQNLNIALSGFSGGADSNASPVKVGSKDVITAILGTNAPKSKLQIAVNQDGSTSFFVTSTSGKTVNAIDVTSLFSFGTLLGPVSKGKTSYSIDSFSFGSSSDTNVSSAPITFTVNGYTTSQSSGAFNSQVNGGGSDANGNTTVLKGNITASAPGKTVTITLPDGGGGTSTNTASF